MFYYSINYERFDKIFKNKKFTFNTRIGSNFGYKNGSFPYQYRVFTVPFSTELIYGKKHQIALGVGLTSALYFYLYDREPEGNVFGRPTKEELFYMNYDFTFSISYLYSLKKYFYKISFTEASYVSRQKLHFDHYIPIPGLTIGRKF